MFQLFSVQYLFSFININMLEYGPGFSCMAVGCDIRISDVLDVHLGERYVNSNYWTVF